MAVAARDDNGYPVLIGVSSTDGVTPVQARTDPVTGYILAHIVHSTYSSTPLSPRSDDNAVRVKTAVTNDASQTPKALISDPTHPGYVLVDVHVI